MRWFNFILAVLVLSYVSVSAQSDPEFLKYFTKVKTVQIDEKVPIKTIIQLDVDKSGKFLVSDAPKNIYLFSATGKLIKELNSDECSPGMKWMLPRAFFKQDGEIFEQNTILGGVRYKNDGTCLKKVDPAMLNTINSSSFSDGAIINYNQLNMTGFLPFNIFDKEGKAISKFGKYQHGFPNAGSQIAGKGGMIVDNKDIIYQAFFNNAQIFKYDRAGKLLGTIYRKPDRYIPLQQDMPKIDMSRFSDKKYVSDIDKYFEEYTYVDNLFMLDTELIMLEYSLGDFPALQIFDRNGKYLLNKDLKLDKKSRLMQAKYGYVYFLIVPDYKKDPKNLNPSIEVYKFKGK